MSNTIGRSQRPIYVGCENLCSDTLHVSCLSFVLVICFPSYFLCVKCPGIIAFFNGYKIFIMLFAKPWFHWMKDDYYLCLLLEVYVIYAFNS